MYPGILIKLISAIRKNLNKIRQEPYSIDFFLKIRIFRVMYPGILIKLISAIRKNLNKIRQEPYSIDFFLKIRIFRVMYPGILIKLISAIFRRNSIINPWSNDQIEKENFISILVPNGSTRVRNQII
jgi:hypothetical protein